MNIKNTAYDKGKLEGKLEERYEIARNLLRNEASIELIVKSTGITEEEIKKLN